MAKEGNMCKQLLDLVVDVWVLYPSCHNSVYLNFFHDYIKQKSPPSFQLFIAAPHWGPGSPMPLSSPGLCCFPGGWRSWVVGTPLSLPSQVCSLHPWLPTYWVRYEYGSRDWMEKYGEISWAEWVRDFSNATHHFPPTETITDWFPGQDTWSRA